MEQEVEVVVVQVLGILEQVVLVVLAVVVTEELTTKAEVMLQQIQEVGVEQLGITDIPQEQELQD